MGADHLTFKLFSTTITPDSSGIWISTVITFIAVPECIAVDVEGVVSEEEQAEPRLERVDGNDQQNSDDPTLFGWILVVYQVLVNLKIKLFISNDLV